MAMAIVMVLRLMMRHTVIFVLTLCSGLLACEVHDGSPEPRVPPQEQSSDMTAFRGIVNKYHEEQQEKMQAKKEEHDSRIENNQNINRETGNTIDACYAACLIENDNRNNKYEALKIMRESVRHICKSTGTANYGRSDLIETDENSPRAHTRIVEENGHLVYVERRVDVVEVRPHWICPDGASDKMKDVATNWMDKMPLDLYRKPCDMLKNGVEYQAFATMPVDVCLRWVSASTTP
jgi:hypothetical protein